MTDFPKLWGQDHLLHATIVCMSPYHITGSVDFVVELMNIFLQISIAILFS